MTRSAALAAALFAVGSGAMAPASRAAAEAAAPTVTASPKADGKTVDQATSVLDDFEGAFTVASGNPGLFPYGSDAASTPALSRVAAADRPSAPAGNHVLQASAAVASWGGFTDDFASAQNWRLADGLAFWVKGSGSGQKIEFEVKTGGADGEHAELWQSSFTDDSKTWKLVKAPFDAMVRRPDHQEPDAPDDVRPALTTAWGYAVNLPPGPAVTLQFDDIELYEKVRVVQDFEGTSPITDVNGALAKGGVFAWGSDATSTPALAVTAADIAGAPDGNRVLDGRWTYDSGYGGFSEDFATGATQDWSAFRGLDFWFLGHDPDPSAAAGKGAPYKIEVRAGGSDAEHAELWQAGFTDDWQGWHLVRIPFTSLKRRTDFQPAGAPAATVFDATHVYGFALTEPPGTKAGVFDVDDFALYGGRPAVPVKGSGLAFASGLKTGCLDATAEFGATLAGDPADLRACNGSDRQKWTLSQGVLMVDGLCLDVSGHATADGSPVAVWDCNGGRNQQWTATAGELVSADSGKCLTVPDKRSGIGVQLVVSTCAGTPGQKWNAQRAPAKASKASDTWPLRVGIAVLLVLLGVALSITRTRRMLVGTVRRAGAGIRGARLPQLRRRRLARELAALVADPATVEAATAALAGAGRDRTWRPYAATVSGSDVVVWLAGTGIPEPAEPWRPVPGDQWAWTAKRAELGDAPQDSDSCPLLMGVDGDAAVIVDVSQSFGLLVVDGDPRRAEKVRAALARQLDGGEVLARGGRAEGRPHWRVDVDAAGWITVHGRRFEFAAPPAAPVAPEAAAVEDGTSAPAQASQPALDQEPAWANVAVSSATTTEPES